MDYGPLTTKITHMRKLLLFVLICAGLYGCSSVPMTGRSQLNLVSDEEVLSLSLQEYNDYIKTAQKSTNQTSTALVVKVGQKIADAVTLYFQATGQEALLANFRWEFNLIEDSQVNAFCMPGGKIVVYTGILPVCQDEAGLAVVLGHEVGHAIAKHANERMSQQVAVNAGADVVTSILGKSSSTVQSIGSVVYGLGAQVGVMLPFNRKQELEADHIGLILMAIAGYDPNVAIPFWQRMAESGSGTVEFLSTHPSDNTRVSEIQKYLPEAMEYYNSIWGTSGSSSSGTTTTTKKATTSDQWRF